MFYEIMKNISVTSCVGLSDLNVTGTGPALATRHIRCVTLCEVGQ